MKYIMKNEHKLSTGLTKKNVQEHNLTTILRGIYESGICSRVEIADKVGLDQATVTRVVQKLVENEIVFESILGKETGQRGRRSIGLELSPNRYRLVVVRLQRLSFRVALLDLTGNIMQETECPIDALKKPSHIFELIVQAIEKVMTDCSEEVLGMGLTLPGPFLERSERIILMTESPDWEDFDIVHRLRKHFSDIPLYSKHDAKAAALSVWKTQGITTGSRMMLYLSAGQGIGAGLVINGEVFRGSLGTAGEIGHTSIKNDGPKCYCGNYGCLEIYCSRLTLFRNLKANSRHSLPYPLNFDDVVEAYQMGDKEVMKEVDQMANYLAQGLVNCINLMNPDLIVLGDEYSRFGEPFLEIISEKVKKRLLKNVYENIRFQLVQQKDDLVLSGSYHHVLQNVLFESTNPTLFN
jgi:predicted NBD/HSP70 family sugar kinase